MQTAATSPRLDTPPQYCHFCDSLRQVVDSDDPELLCDYVNIRGSELKAVDVQKNSLLMLLLIGKAKKCALELIQRYRQSLDLTQQNDQGRTALFLACAVGATDVALELIRQDPAKLLQKDAHGITPLHVAVEKNLVDVVCEVSLAARRDPQFRALLPALFADHSSTPLHIAAKSSTRILQEVLEFAPAIDPIDEEAMTPLHHAVTSLTPTENVTLLRNRTNRVDAVDACGRTPLSIASGLGNPAVVQILLDGKASPDIGQPCPLLSAFMAGHLPIFEKLLGQRASPNVQVNGIPLHDILCALDERAFAAALIRHGGVPSTRSISLSEFHDKARNNAKPPKRISLTKLVSKKTQQQLDPADASRAANWSIDELLKLLKTYKHAKDKDGNNLLQLALLADNFTAFLLLLHSNPAFVNEPNVYGKTALHMAVRRAKLLETHLLVKFGADSNALDNEKNSPLHIVCNMLSSDRGIVVPIINILHSRGARLEASNSSDRTPLDEAFETLNNTVFESLLKLGASSDKVLIKTCDRVNYAWTEIVILARAKRIAQSTSLSVVEASSMGLTAAAKPDRKVEYQTPISTVLQKFNNPEYKDQISTVMKLFELLLQHGADRNRPFAIRSLDLGSKMITPLGFATRHALTEILRLLLDSGADIDGKTKDFPRPIQIACALGNPDLVELLMKYRPRIPQQLKKLESQLPPKIREKLSSQAADVSARIVPKFEDLRLHLSNNTPPSPASSARSLATDEDDDIQEIEKGMEGIHMFDDNAPKLFNRHDTLDEERMRLAEMISSTCLMRQESRLLPGSLCRLRGIEVAIQGHAVPEAKNRDAKTVDIIRAVLHAINEQLKICKPGYDSPERLTLLSNMHSINTDKIKQIDIYQGREVINRDIAALKLLSKESAILVMLPVGVQIQNYANHYLKGIEMRPMKTDQWTSVNVIKTETGLTAIGYGNCGITVREKQDQEPYTAATFRIDGEINWNETTGQTMVTIRRSNLRFDPKTTLKIQYHIYTALNAPITYSTVYRSKN